AKKSGDARYFHHCSNRLPRSLDQTRGVQGRLQRLSCQAHQYSNFAPTSRRSRLPWAASPAFKPGALMNILIVEDNPTNRKLLRVTLEAEGHNTLEALDGVEALAVLDRQPVDAVISDILMPR